MLAISENNDIHSLKFEPGSKPKAIPGFSVNVILKKFPITVIDSPRNMPTKFISKNGMLMPFI
jgi:hypothetical protein